jgi:hypothetical protein
MAFLLELLKAILTPDGLTKGTPWSGMVATVAATVLTGPIPRRPALGMNTILMRRRILTTRLRWRMA